MGKIQTNEEITLILKVNNSVKKNEMNKDLILTSILKFIGVMVTAVYRVITCI